LPEFDWARARAMVSPQKSICPHNIISRSSVAVDFCNQVFQRLVINLARLASDGTNLFMRFCCKLVFYVPGLAGPR
jgi:hypothetical protein